MLLLYFSHMHCLHDLFKHIQTVYVTNLIALQLNRSHPHFRICKRSHTQSLYSGVFLFFFFWLKVSSSELLQRTKWFWVRVQLQSLNLHISRLLQARSSLTFSQLQSVDSLWNVYMTWQEHILNIDTHLCNNNTAYMSM